MSTQLQPIQVYVSYHDDDERWVDEELWPRLATAGVAHIDKRDFSPLVPELVETQRSVMKARYSLLIITPSYLHDNFSKFETVLLLQYGLDRNKVLAIPVIKDSVKDLPFLLSFPQRVNVSLESDWASSLLEVINHEPPAPADLTDPAYINARKAHDSQPKIKAGLEALIELMRMRSVKDAVRRYEEDFEEASEQIKILADYKNMHDKLHDLETGCYRLLILAQSSFNTDQTRSDLIDYESILQLKVEKIRELAQENTFAQYETDWLRNLEDGLTYLGKAKHGDEQAMKRTVWNIGTVLGRAPSSINDRLMEAARNLRLADLVFAMAAVREQFHSPLIDRGKLDQFGTAIKHLADFHHRLDTLKKEHDRWQNVDNHLRRIQRNLKGNDISELENSWPQLSDLSAALSHGRKENWATNVSAYALEIESTLESGNIAGAKLAFQNFSNQAINQFIRVDTALLSVCEELRLVSNSLAAVVDLLRAFTYE